MMLSKKALDVKIMDLSGLSSFADFFVLCSGESDTQVKAISDEIDKTFAKAGIKCYHKEGTNTYNWVLMDYLDVVVHIFKTEARSFYNLEKLWGDAKVIEVKDEPDTPKK